MAGRTRQPNVVLVSLDSVRADVALNGAFAALEKLRELGTTFPDTVSSSPLTPVSHATILTGVQPPRHGIRHLFRESLRSDIPTLAEAFRSAGYETGAVVSCPGLNRWYRLDRGFETYDDALPRLPDGSDPLQTVDVKLRGYALKRADAVVERALAWVEKRTNVPFFQFVHFFDAHWPYAPPQQFGTPAANPYEGEVAYIDHFLGQYLQRLFERGLFEKTLITVLSDHGEDLGGWYSNDHGGSEFGHPEEQGHGCLLYDATQVVPLILHWPGVVPCGRTIDVQVRLVDVAPTVAELVGLTLTRTDGESLVTIMGSDTAPHRLGYSETFYPVEQFEATGAFPGLHALRALRIANHYKIIWQVSGDRVEFYDLRTDPGERKNLWPCGIYC